MTYPLVAELADVGVPVTVSCRVLKLARQPYYRWRNDPVRDSDMLRTHRINALHDAHAEDPTFGYRYLADEARRAGWRMSRRTAWKLCSQAGILSSAQRRRRGKGKKAGPPVFDDHVKRQFRADAPNRVWLTDITEHRTNEGKLYCCAIKDVHFNGIVGYSISDRMTAKLAVNALRAAVTRRGDVAGCILHADRGSQFRSRAMARELRRHDMVGSMGRVGAAGDNAAMESFWSLLQTNVLNRQRWASRQDLRLAIVVWIERKYHRQRAQDTLGGLTPIELEAKLTEPRSLAAQTEPVTSSFLTPKHWAVVDLSGGRVIEVAPTFSLRLVFNPGVAFGLGSGLGPIVAVVLMIVLTALAGWIAVKVWRGDQLVDVLLLPSFWPAVSGM